ncbi:MAG TPA: BON domain-containing protein [Bryobacteraceae bacterium]|nr:BON domain-containing protein [Bryobacteraceae bacterium]
MKPWTNRMPLGDGLMPAPAEFAPGRMPGATIARTGPQACGKPVMLPNYNVFDAFSVSVDGPWVTLTGRVTHPATKADAEHALRRIVGATAVNNQIEVLPWSPNDDRLRKSLYRAVYGHPALETFAVRAVPPIHLIVENGHVSLEGAVPNAAAKSIAERQANSVPGVFSVTNKLLVETP